MSGNYGQRVIWAAMMLLVWAGLILLGGVASLLLLHHVAPSIPQGPYHDLYGTLVVFVTWPVFTFVLRFGLRHGLLGVIGLLP